MARRCSHRIIAPSPTSSPAAPKRSADSSGAAITAAPCCTSSTPAATAPARSVTPSRRRLGSNSVARRCYRFPISTSPSPCPSNCGPRWVGGTVGVLAVLHTWTQRLIFHPHVHCLVTGGGLSDDGAIWHPAGKTFLFPKTALAALARARFRDAFARLCPAADLPPHVWQIPWVVHITPWGQGQQAALDYLARYAFRIAITNNRILAVDDATVTYRYKDRAADRQRQQTVTGHEFVRRFLQHVLPAGFHKVRYYGLWHASRQLLRNLRNVLLLAQPARPPAQPAPEPDADPQAPPSPRRCPHCQTGHLILLRRLSPARPQGP